VQGFSEPRQAVGHEGAVEEGMERRAAAARAHACPAEPARGGEVATWRIRA